jgi:hypothetical protein
MYDLPSEPERQQDSARRSSIPAGAGADIGTSGSAGHRAGKRECIRLAVGRREPAGCGTAGAGRNPSLLHGFSSLPPTCRLQQLASNMYAGLCQAVTVALSRGQDQQGHRQGIRIRGLLDVVVHKAGGRDRRQMLFERDEPSKAARFFQIVRRKVMQQEREVHPIGRHGR